MTIPPSALPAETPLPPPDPRLLEAVFASQSMRRALSEAAWAVRVILHADASLIFLHQPESNTLAAAAWHGREAADVSLPLDAPYPQALWQSRRSIAWQTRAECADPALADLLESMGVVSGMLLPLRVNSATIGMWLVAGSTPRNFDENDEHIIATLAENIKLATESMLLSIENQRYRREADALYEIGTEISQLLDLDRVLELIVQKTRSLLNAELSYLALADEEARVVRVRVTDGTRSTALSQMVLPFGEGVGGWVATNRKPLLVDDYPNDTRPKPPGIAEIAATEDIHSIISVPMFTRSGLVGVLFAASRKVAIFNPSQMGLLAALGTQAAIAIENARLYQKEKSTAEKLLAATSTHEKLLQLVLGNQGLQTIVNTLSGLVRAPVLIEDEHHRALCESSAGAVSLTGQPLQHVTFSTADVWHDPDLAESVHILQHVHAAIHLPPRPQRKLYHPRTIAPIVAGQQLRGYVSVLELSPLDEQQYAAIEQASIVLALEFMKIEAAQEVEARLAGDLLDDLVFGRSASDPSLLLRAARFNVDLLKPHRMLVLDIDQFSQAVRHHHWSDMEALAVKRKFLGTVKAQIQRSLHGALLGTRSDSVLVLLPTSASAPLAEAQAQAAALHAALQAALPELTISIGIGRPAADLSQLTRSYEDAMLALRTIAQLGGRGQAVSFEALGVIPLLLQSQDQKELVAFMEQHLAALLHYDQHNQSQLTETLEAYLANNGNLRLTAAACHVHLNSLKYRLRRIEEIGGLDLRSGETRFRLQLALAVHRAINLVAG